MGLDFIFQEPKPCWHEESGNWNHRNADGEDCFKFPNPHFLFFSQRVELMEFKESERD